MLLSDATDQARTTEPRVCPNLTWAQLVTSRGEEIEALLQRLSDVNGAMSRHGLDARHGSLLLTLPQRGDQHGRRKSAHTGPPPGHPPRVYTGDCAAAPARGRLAHARAAGVPTSAQQPDRQSGARGTAGHVSLSGHVLLADCCAQGGARARSLWGKSPLRVRDALCTHPAPHSVQVQGGNSTQQLLRERGSIHSSSAQLDDVLGQAQAAVSSLAAQRSLFADISAKLGTVGAKFPVVNSLVTSIRRKKSKDTIVLSIVVALCTLFLLAYRLR